ncbi:hypothetical protein [Halogeometricum luteum]|uniref:Uncharacterized protein n=1 Tax=Halogeometricum luteum TaxID=2950537 RepID=A0ABU2G0D0_9EURY|nr:hypothetical protein [Halogeometricum sp. S3BR5-2]MDS0294240.1 hypothetical protein [Halogeometricum sp. S3BR5-2]
MTEPEIPEDDPETRHDPSALGWVSILGVVAFVGLVAFAWTDSALLSAGTAAVVGLFLAWTLG